MKTKAQKGEELKKGKELFDKSEVLVFSDFTGMTAENMRRFRNELKAVGASLLIIKKRLLNIALKESGIDFDAKQFKSSLGTVFSAGNAEKISGPVFKFFSSLQVPEGKEKDMWIKHILGGYDTKNKTAINSEDIIFIGKLPSKEVLLGQLLGMLTSPLRSLMYVLDERSKQSS